MRLIAGFELVVFAIRRLSPSILKLSPSVPIESILGCVACVVAVFGAKPAIVATVAAWPSIAPDIVLSNVLVPVNVCVPDKWAVSASK